MKEKLILIFLTACAFTASIYVGSVFLAALSFFLFICELSLKTK